MSKLTLKAWGNDHQISLSVHRYQNNGNLAIQMLGWEDWDGEEFAQPYGMLTVNLTKKCKPNCAFIDTNNNGDYIIDWLEENGLGMQTGNFEISGFCIYPEFEFDMDVVAKYKEGA